MIEITVALPMFRAQRIGWLSLESLCRQQHIPIDQQHIPIGWEVIVAEEQISDKMGEELIRTYEGRLKAIACQKITYIPLKDWIPLSNKWVLIAKEADPNSKCFIFQAADCYSQPLRLHESYNLLVKRNKQWISSQIGPFYNIYTEHIALYDRRKAVHPTGLNMAVSTQLIREVSNLNVKSAVDSRIYSACRVVASQKALPFKIGYNNGSGSWIRGVDTQGLNNISSFRGTYMRRHTKYYKKTNLVLNDCVPKDVADRLKECKKYCRASFV